MISPEQKSELLEAIKSYGRAEYNCGKAIANYCGLDSIEDASTQLNKTFGEVINILNRL